MRALVLVLLLAGCKIGALFEPVPTLVWACADWTTVVVRNTAGEPMGSTRFCRHEGWTRRVDTLWGMP